MDQLKRLQMIVGKINVLIEKVEWREKELRSKVEILLKEGQRVGRIRTNLDNYYYIDKKEFR